jgi:hypothetical protein
MKFIKGRALAGPDAAVRKLMEITNAVEAVQDGRIYIERVNGPFLTLAARRTSKAEFQYNPCRRRPAESLCLWIQWTTTIATKPRLWRHVLRSHENEKLIEEIHDLAFLVTTFGRI